MGLKPSAHLGKELAELKSHLLQMNEYVSNCLQSMHFPSRTFHTRNSGFLSLVRVYEFT
jgi:hypothetical protein